MSELKTGDKVTWNGKIYEVKGLISDKRRPAAMLEASNGIRVHNVAQADLVKAPAAGK